MTVRVVVEGGPFAGVTRAEVARRARAMLGELELGNAELSVLLTDDEQIKKLNHLYRKKNRPTDVLAFAQEEGLVVRPGAARRLLGDVVVSVPTAARQAGERGCGVLAEVTMLLAHGLLHLLGWDHVTAAEDRRMRRETWRLSAVADGAAGSAPATGGRRGVGAAGVETGSRARVNGDSAPQKRRRRAR